ncbi:ABC transporter thiamine pyrophosphate-binding lipoprotein p37/Cypl [Mycoplasmopsis meleagridis]|uniref:ABC transporter thiamine pyrophosphate-binding lipoprotein p37/Cypl n=1 Tax=Mycoplasmopsis meleagridis TaxID=29561 RepID=UPI003A8AB865
MNKKIFNFFIKFLSLIPISFLSVSCQNTKNNENFSWDNEITIFVSQLNDGFANTDKEKNFLNLLENRFNKIKNENSQTAKFENVKFKIGVNEQKELLFDDLKAGKKNVDLAFISYSRFANHYINNVESFPLKIIGQSYALQFTWSNDNDDNIHYINGLEDDPLRKMAEEENLKQFKEHGEYPSWVNKEKELDYNNSIYNVFYKKNDYTPLLHGAILISGDKKTRNQIIEAWDNKNWDKFLEFGIIIGDYDSGTKYKYPLSILSKHFGISLAELDNIFKEDNKNILKGQKARNQLGKVDSNGNIKHIAFENEGVFNWTRSNNLYFKPYGYIESEENNYQSEINNVVRLLTFTNPAPYDILVARSNINDYQKDILIKVFDSLTKEENTFGNYTGYNKVKSINFETFKKYVEMQNNAQKQ